MKYHLSVNNIDLLSLHKIYSLLLWTLYVNISVFSKIFKLVIHKNNIDGQSWVKDLLHIPASRIIRTSTTKPIQKDTKSYGSRKCA